MDKVFENNPNLKVYYKTSDGTAFYNESDAKLHAKSLKDKNVSPVQKEEREVKAEKPSTSKKVNQTKQD